MKTQVAAIEFGTSKIVTLIAQSGSVNRCDIIGSGTVPYDGFAQGDWNTPEQLARVARDSIAAIGGTIALTSTPGKGTTVVFTLPVEDDESVPPAVFCEAADYLSDRFSPLRVALSDSIDCPL